MVKKCLLICMGFLILSMFPALAQREVTSLEGLEFYPDEQNAAYIYQYSVPQLETGDTDVIAMVINETIVTALNEMRGLIFPMFAGAEAMTQEGQRTVTQRFEVTCNNERLFSYLILKEEAYDHLTTYNLEAEVFDAGGEYAGDILTLRGVVRVGESSDEIAQAVLPFLYQEYLSLCERGVCVPGIDEELFEVLCAPTMDFYADEFENAVFFFQPSLMTEPSFDVPTFTFTPEELAALCEAMRTDITTEQ